MLKFSILFLLILSGCGFEGYNSSYIISHVEEEVAPAAPLEE